MKKKTKKTGAIIILHMCTKNYDQMIPAIWCTTDGWRDGETDRRTDGRMHAGMDAGMDGGGDGQVDGRTGRQMDAWKK